jgi:hypothetical protein
MGIICIKKLDIKVEGFQYILKFVTHADWSSIYYCISAFLYNSKMILDT